MKRHLLAIAVGSLFALPALANNEIDAGNLPANVTPSLTQAQVRAELIAAQRAGDVIVNAELGTTGRTVRHAGRTRDEVVAELIAAQQAGEVIVNAELGTMGRPVQHAVTKREPVLVEMTMTRNYVGAEFEVQASQV
jgi:hypothetical protein